MATIIEIPFYIFKIIHRLLRGSGLGKFYIFRKIRDYLYNIFRPRRPLTIEVRGLRLKVRADLLGGVAPHLLLDEDYDPFETTLIENLLKSSHVFIDVGANIGYYSLIAARKVSESGKVVAFEPEPTNYEILKENILMNKITNIICEQQALGEKTEQKELFIDSKNSGGHHLYNLNNGSKSVLVKTITLEDYIKKNPMKVDFIKMDIQGYEPCALRGMIKV